MTPEKKKQDPEKLSKIVEKKNQLRQKALKEGERPVFFGFGMFGMVGWTVAIPTVAGIFLGRWLDAGKAEGSTISWTLTCLFAGLLFGIIGAWQWINREGKGHH